MKRDYKSGENSSATMFVGTEVEKTPAHGLKTLFVVGMQPLDKVFEIADALDIGHIYIGANHSFAPQSNEDWWAWESYVKSCLEHFKWVSVDMDLKYAEAALESGWDESTNYIAIISVKIPYSSLFNYNTIVKIDDKDFKATNPGVWCWPLHDLKDRNKFTDWTQYGQDEIIK